MATFDEQFENFMNEPLSSENTARSSLGKAGSTPEAKVAPAKPKDLWWVKNPPKKLGEPSHSELKDAGSVIASKSPSRSDVVSSLVEFLQKEKQCKEQKSGKGTTPVGGEGDLTDDDLSSIKEQLSAGDGTDKSVEEILKEYEDMQQSIDSQWKSYVATTEDLSCHSGKNGSVISGDAGEEKSIEEIFKEYEEEQRKNEESWKQYCGIMSGHPTHSADNSSDSSNKLSAKESASEKSMEDIMKEFSEISQESAEVMKKITNEQLDLKIGILKPSTKRRKDPKTARQNNLDVSNPYNDAQDGSFIPTECQNRNLSSSLTAHEKSSKVGIFSSSDMPIVSQATDTFIPKNRLREDTACDLPCISNNADFKKLKLIEKVDDSKISLHAAVSPEVNTEETFPNEVARMEEEPLAVNESFDKESELIQDASSGATFTPSFLLETPEERDALSTVIEESSVETSIEEGRKEDVRRASDVPASSSELQRIRSLEHDLALEQKKVSELERALDAKENEFVKQKNLLKQKYETQIFELQRDIRILKAQVAEHEKEGAQRAATKGAAREDARTAMLEKELQQQEQLILGCQRENLRLCQEVRQAKEELKAREARSSAERQQLQAQLLSAKQRAVSDSSVQRESLLECVKDKEETIVKLKLEIETLKERNEALRRSAAELEAQGARLRSEAEQLTRAAAVGRGGSSPQGGTASAARELDRCRQELRQREAEARALGQELALTRGCLEARRDELTAAAAERALGAEALETRVSQLQSVLATDRAELKARLAQSEEDKRKILDLTRQVREMERILKRKHPNSISALIMAANSETDVPDNSPRVKYLENRVQQLELELERKGSEASGTFQQIQEQFHAMKVRYEQQVAALELELGTAKHEASQAAARQRHRQPPPPPASALAVREDSHRVATIRGLRGELHARERDVQRLGRELGAARRGARKASDDAGHRPSSNPEGVRASEEAVTTLEQQNSSLRRDLEKLEEEYRQLKMKRIRDAEPERDLGPRVAELQSQLCTQKLVISQLREQLKQLDECREEAAVLRIERDHLEKSTTELTRKLAALRRSHMPEDERYEALQERILELEARHELREERLQAVVRDLLRRSAEQRQPRRGTGGDDAAGLRQRLLDKNRQLCLYQAEMDRILEALQGLHHARGD
ncbi:centrosomal protein of 162 kDa isoform X2 [Bacillus rossius redtenbacheri]|uniref:centrosomal protein of 162 kDa isoform X2 n=1 Tax=Bacillus rossius redtenbacheri TaxID=93214 RepID=UPI002FDD59BF